jgi:transposase-like protein
MCSQLLPLPGLGLPEDPPGLVPINDRCCFQTCLGRRLVAVGGILIASYTLGDGAAETMAMVNLVETGAATQMEVARAFGCSTRQVRRHQRQRDNGEPASSRRRGRQPGATGVVRLKAPNVKTVRRLKDTGTSNREIARRLGVCEKSVRNLLKRMGWKPSPAGVQPALPGLGPGTVEPTPSALPVIPPEAELPEPCPSTLDRDPSNRCFDRILARLGALDDARPLFQPGLRIPHAGVLVALPILVRSGVLAAAREVYGSIGPAFYGLRSTLLILLFMALLRIQRPEGLKEHVPAELGRLVGLDRAPEVKTLRHKLERLAKLKRAERFGRELARLRMEGWGDALGFLYVDGHVRVYHGKHKLPKAHVARMRITLPATSDYWVNDQAGDPLFMVTAKANAGLVQILPEILAQCRDLLGKRPLTVVFDRGGWSPKLFKKLLADEVHVLTYRKGKTPDLPEKKFKLRKARIDGEKVEYWLNDKTVKVKVDGETLKLRQVTRLKDGHQTQVITTRWDLSAVEVAHRMFNRWRQENWFKYMREEFLLDALVEYEVEPDDPERSVPNPERRRLDKEVTAARQELANLQEAFGAAAVDNVEALRPTMRGFKIAHGKLGKQIRAARTRLDALMAWKAALPARVPVGEAVKNPIVKLAPERKRLTDLLKMVAYQAESDLLALIRPHYARAEDEGRTLVQTILTSAADLEVTPDELRVEVAPLSSKHRTKVLAALCEELGKFPAIFPGTHLWVRYAVSFTGN